MRRIIISVVITATLATLASGCYATGSGYYGGTVTATTVAPDLVYVSPGVQVVADYDYPVFYADNYYWRYDNNRWYRSSWYTGGWAYADAPYHVRSISRPHSYRHYRPNGYVSRSRPTVRDHRSGYRDTRPTYNNYRQPAVRDHRTNRAPASSSYRAPARTTAPVVRDHRTSRPASQPSRSRAKVRDHR